MHFSEPACRLFRDFRIDQRSDTHSKILPHKPECSPDELHHLLKKHPRISIIELRDAFDLNSDSAVLELAAALLEKNMISVHDGFLIYMPK